jgi:hypothetical protein
VLTALLNTPESGVAAAADQRDRLSRPMRERLADRLMDIAADDEPDERRFTLSYMRVVDPTGRPRRVVEIARRLLRRGARADEVRDLLGGQDMLVPGGPAAELARDLMDADHGDRLEWLKLAAELTGEDDDAAVPIRAAVVRLAASMDPDWVLDIALAGYEPRRIADVADALLERFRSDGRLDGIVARLAEVHDALMPKQRDGLRRFLWSRWRRDPTQRDAREGQLDRIAFADAEERDAFAGMVIGLERDDEDVASRAAALRYLVRTISESPVLHERIAALRASATGRDQEVLDAITPA